MTPRPPSRSRGPTIPGMTRILSLAVIPVLAAVVWPTGDAEPVAVPPGSGTSAEVAAPVTDPPVTAFVIAPDPALSPPRGQGEWRMVDAHRAPFPLRIDGAPATMAITPVTVLPGEEVTLEGPAGLELVHSDGQLVQQEPGRWLWEAPDRPGIQGLRALDRQGRELWLTLLVARPAAEAVDGVLGGYRIGAYRSEPLRGDPAYLPPRGFVEVRREDEDIRVSPHFTLGQFLCKQDGDPRYLAVSLPLLMKLELLLDAVNEAGIPASGFTVMSGFRTPFYNRSIGNTTDYSRHLWGDAADIFIDENGDGEMDDLNGDGVRSIADARTLAGVMETLAGEQPEAWVPGGIASYRRNAVHGPFVHVDARGHAARW